MASTPGLLRSWAVGFIDWLDRFTPIYLSFERLPVGVTGFAA